MKIPTLPDSLYAKTGNVLDHGTFDSEAMQAYGKACARAALEEAAKVCDAQECGEASDYGQGNDAAAQNCASAIRAIEVE